MDIKSLYLNAKNAGEISAYTEAVNQLSVSNPRDYVTQLEYIIKSNIGLATVKPFIEKFGLPIPLWESMVNVLTECKAKSKNAEYTALVENTIADLKAFREKYIQCFAMYEYYNEDKDSSLYISTYYGESKNNVQNRYLLAGMIKKFGECAIPDMLITADKIGSQDKVISYLSENTDSMMAAQWIYTAAKSIGMDATILESKTPEHIVSVMNGNKQRLYQEAVITMNENATYEYSRDEIDALGELISFKEYQSTWADETGINLTECMNEIYSLYEEYDGMEFEDVADNVLSMKPVAMAEKPINTADKKTGKVANYIKRNHDMASWGEDDDDDKKPEDSEPTLNDFRRPSAKDDDIDDIDVKDDTTPTDDESKKPENQPGGNNYYYYTYTNSLNKNSNSFNKDNSKHDSHDVSTSTSVDSHDTTINNGDVAVKGNQELLRKKEEEKKKKDEKPFNAMESFNLNII